jgi:hypothetical protein
MRFERSNAQKREPPSPNACELEALLLHARQSTGKISLTTFYLLASHRI